MSGSVGIASLQAEYLALEANIERAGMALACVYSSSDEFEAAVIHARRDQWKAGRKRRAWLWILASMLIVLLVLPFLAQ